jgi:hypothetical protein
MGEGYEEPPCWHMYRHSEYIIIFTPLCLPAIQGLCCTIVHVKACATSLCVRYNCHGGITLDRYDSTRKPSYSHQYTRASRRPSSHPASPHDQSAPAAVCTSYKLYGFSNQMLQTSTATTALLQCYYSSRPVSTVGKTPCNMGPYNGPLHAYEGSVEYPSAESFRSRSFSHRVLPHTARSPDDGSGMTLSQEQHARVAERRVRCDSYTTDSSTPRSQCVGLQAHPRANSISEPTLQRYPTLQDLQMTPTTRVESSSWTSQEPPRPEDNRHRRDLIRARSDNLVIEAAERATAPRRIRPAIFWRQWHRRELGCLPPRYEDSFHRTDYLPRLVIGYLSHDLGATLEDNTRDFLTRVPTRYMPDVAVVIWADSMGTSNEARVRRILISFNSLPPETEDANPVPPYGGLWEERCDARFGSASVPAYET